MKTLGDAWEWYNSANRNLRRMQRLGRRHWDDESLESSSIAKDQTFKEVSASTILRETELALEPIDDLGILVMFSVFEASVRDHLEKDLEPPISLLVHPLLKDAAQDVLEGVRQGSFANRVLSPLQDQGRITSELSSDIKQVRDYRNWIAHGRRDPRPLGILNLSPKEAFRRLKEFLDLLGIASIAETPEAELGEREP